jgi:hypothetical protein
MRNRTFAMALAVGALVIPLLLAACSSGSIGGEVVIRCDECQTVDMYENFQAGNVVGVVEPGNQGVVVDKHWGKLYGCMMYEVAVGDQQGWVCEKFLSFQ